MSEQLFDNFVRDKLKDYSSPVPQGLWGKIVADKEYHPKGFWRLDNTTLIALTGLILLMGGYFIYNNLSGDNTIEKQNAAITSSNNNSSPKNNSSTSTNSTLNSATVLGKNDNPTDKNIKSKSTGIESAYSAPGTANQKPSDYTISSATNTKRNNSLLNFSSKEEANFAENNNSQLNNPSEGLQLGLTKKESSYGELIRLYPNHLFAPNILQIPPFNLRSILGLGNDCPSAYGSQRNDWYLEIYGSPDYSIKTIAGNGLSSLYLQKKDSTEHMRLGYTIGARISKNVGDHFMLKAGLQYSQIDEHFSQRKENETKTVTVIVSRTIVRPQGDTTFKDTTSVTQVGYAVKSSRNHYSNIEIPVSIGYEFGHEKDLWKVAVNGGAIFNITSWYAGETLDTALNIVSTLKGVIVSIKKI